MQHSRYEPGEKFGNWTILKNTAKRKAICQCLCGVIKEVYVTNLGSGKSKSCGCIKHVGFVNTKLYGVYTSMKSRCYNKNHRFYKHYGARGITVCDEWLRDKKTFYCWAIKNGYKEGLSLDRVDNNLGYSPKNCRWATQIQQHNNTRSNLFIVHNGLTKTVAQWARETGINNRTILSRIRAGWRKEDLFNSVKKGGVVN